MDKNHARDIACCLKAVHALLNLEPFIGMSMSSLNLNLKKKKWPEYEASVVCARSTGVVIKVIAIVVGSIVDLSFSHSWPPRSLTTNSGGAMAPLPPLVCWSKRPSSQVNRLQNVWRQW